MKRIIVLWALFKLESTKLGVEISYEETQNITTSDREQHTAHYFIVFSISMFFSPFFFTTSTVSSINLPYKGKQQSLSKAKSLSNPTSIKSVIDQRIRVNQWRQPCPVSTIHLNNVVLMLGQRRRRGPTLNQHCLNISCLLCSDIDSTTKKRQKNGDCLLFK